MILSNIVEEIMNGDSQSVVTYSIDGSSLNHTGNFLVQLFKINGVQRILPTLGIFTETKKSLAELAQTTLEIFSAAIACMYTESQIIAKIDFVITDTLLCSTGLNEMVCEEKESEYVPSSLVCSIYPLMMMQLKVNNYFKPYMTKLETMKSVSVFTLTLISKVNLFHSKPLDT